jgi:hypothetical protein
VKKRKKQKAKRKRRAPYWYEPPAANIPMHPDYKGPPTGFENDTFWDHLTWLDDDHRRDAALRAVVQADTTGDRRWVNDFLKSKRVISDFGRAVIDDYKARNLKGKSGPKQNPMYAFSRQDAVRTLAVERAKYLMRAKGYSREKAFEKAAQEQGVDLITLHSFDQKRLGSSRRMAARRKAARK